MSSTSILHAYGGRSHGKERGQFLCVVNCLFLCISSSGVVFEQIVNCRDDELLLLNSATAFCMARVLRDSEVHPYVMYIVIRR